ncbi:MAG: PD-(D/E)XK nuclease family protein [Clostridia bacterium]|nr:PD-(D/E)XK nuclease family protein [Clostridia bacterium]
MAEIRIVTTRAPGLIPSLIREISSAPGAVVLVPESFTLACETEIVSHTRVKGFFDLKIFSPSSLIREVRELTGHGSRKPVSGDGQNMIVSRLLHHHQADLKYYRDSVAQPALAQQIAGQIDEFTRAGLTPDILRSFRPSGRRTAAKLNDVALIWEEYQQALGKEYADTVGQWASAVAGIARSGLLRNARLLIFGFDYITLDILSLVLTAIGKAGASEVVLGLISDDLGPDRAIFRQANDSVRSLADWLSRHKQHFSVLREEALPPLDPGIAYVEKSIYAMGVFPGAKQLKRSQGSGLPPKTIVLREDPFAARQQAQGLLEQAPVPDMSRVRTYYAKNSYLECQHACQTLIEWHRDGIPWEEMAVAVCEHNTLPALLPLTLSAAGIPFNAKQDQPILMSAYAQYVLSLLRVLRLNFARNDVLRMLKTGFTSLSPSEVMELENYARKNAIHRSRWLKPFYLPEKEGEREKAEALETLRQRLIDPIVDLKKQLSGKDCTGRQAAALLFRFIMDAGVYDRLLLQEEEYAARGDDLGIDRNRQVWTAVNELLDSIAAFIGDEPLPLHDLCTMLEASLASRSVKSLPQLSRAVMVAPPQMFFSSGIRCMIVMGMQETEVTSGTGILSEPERAQLEAYIQNSGDGSRPFVRIGQSRLDLAARQKQDVYQAVSLARDRLMISCAGARPGGGVLTPSAAFRQLEKAVRLQNPENCTGGLMDTDLRPFAPSFALEALAVRLRESRDGRNEFLQSGAPDEQRWKNALASLYQSDVWRLRTKGVLDGLHVSVPAEGITPQQAESLYAAHGFTISRVETFGSCPRRHLLRYGLDLFPAETFAFQRNEQGTFNHDVLKLFLDAAMKLPEWPDLPDQQVSRLLNAVLRERVKQWEGGVLRSDIAHRYQGVAIIRGIRTSIASLMRSFQQKPHFLPMAAEIPFGMPDGSSPLNLPAIQIQLSDGRNVAFSGRIDRIDRLELPDGKRYFLIVDNKMSPKEVKQNAIVAGLQLQLPLYIRAAQNGLSGFAAAGGLYQPIKDVLVSGTDPGQIRTQIDRELQTSGIILDDQAVQEAMKPVKIARRSESNDVLSAVSPDELQTVMDCALHVVAERVERIRAGETAPAPLQDGLESPCAWCDHPDACPYDATLPGCRIRELDHRHRMELKFAEDGYDTVFPVSSDFRGRPSHAEI